MRLSLPINNTNYLVRSWLANNQSQHYSFLPLDQFTCSDPSIVGGFDECNFPGATARGRCIANHQARMVGEGGEGSKKWGVGGRPRRRDGAGPPSGLTGVYLLPSQPRVYDALKTMLLMSGLASSKQV